MNPYLHLTVRKDGLDYRCKAVADDSAGKNARVKCGQCGYGVLYYAEHDPKPLMACRRCGAKVVGIGISVSRSRSTVIV